MASSGALQMRPHAAKGRALYSRRAFAPGATMELFAAPLVLLPSVDRLADVCAHCLRPGRVRACAGCGAAFYCGPRCQAAAWKRVHGRECRLLRERRLDNQTGAALPTPVRALIQLLLRPQAEAAVAPLEGHLADRRAEPTGWADLEMMARAACLFAGRALDRVEIDKAAELLCKIQTNAFHRYDADLGHVGVFLDPTLAMANHSCVPNATVHFLGRQALLRAERPVLPGDEVEISYIVGILNLTPALDYTQPLYKRSEALSSYRFQCRCPRCQDDLSVYQVCAASPAALFLLPSLVPYSALRQQLSAACEADKTTVARASGESATRWLDARPIPEVPLAERRQALLALYRHGKPLVEAGLWAVAPLPQLLTEISLCFVQEGNYPFALTIVCLLATACDPVRYAAPFQPVRTKNVFMVAKMLANTADQAPLPPGAASRLSQRVRETLGEIDQVSLCQMLLHLVQGLAPDGLAGEWELALSAREMLTEIEQLPGREKELSLIKSWEREPGSDQSQAFFNYAVVQQLESLAKLGRAVLEAEFGADG